jgi:hypothetical protein
VNFSNVPKEWRYSAPPGSYDELMPCHVSYNASNGYSRVEPAYELSRSHGQSQRWSTRSAPSLTELDATGFAKRNVAPYISPILDTRTLSLVLKDLGLHGKAIPKVIKGRQYIVLSGYAGFRRYLTGTIYSAKNRKIIQMAIGSLGIKNSVKSGARLTIYLTGPLTILEWFLKDQHTMSVLIGNVAMDLAKIGIGAIMSAIAGLGIGAMVSSAATPIFVTIVAGVFTGILLEEIDTQYGLTAKLVAVIEEYSQAAAKKKEALELKLGRGLYEAERELIWRGTGFDVKNPFGLR